MPWLLQFINDIVEELPENLNATITRAEEFEVSVVELDEQSSYVEKKIISNRYGLFFILQNSRFWECILVSEQNKEQNVYWNNYLKT
ncbi:putative transposase remnant [Candidatus Protochlamydia naegleriophila]|uniref:Putative transposase remnant n=1 Tax=Candidatus Protochlamydia naegleriophila TaxID=389348 RepID=A0A0U5JG69_9BACT|nr:putative transposase remnant [Candidatus Protochlamydia naegleriophila]